MYSLPLLSEPKLTNPLNWLKLFPRNQHSIVKSSPVVNSNVVLSVYDTVR